MQKLPPAQSRAGRSHQFFFLNERLSGNSIPIKTKYTMTYARCQNEEYKEALTCVLKWRVLNTEPVSYNYILYFNIRTGRKRMKAFLLACISAIVVAIVAAGALNTIQKPVDEAFSTTSVRL